MEITWLGHSCFRVKGKETTLVTDPYDESIGYPMTRPRANICTSSHAHPGHGALDSVAGEPRLVHGPGEYEIAGIFITGIGTFHDAEGGRVRGKNTAYLIEMEEVTLCHLGDLGHVPTAEQVEELSSTDVLFIPVGGVSTIDAAVAAEVVRLLQPRIVIPMHYKTEVLRFELEPIDRFLKEMGIKEALAQPRTSVTKSGLPEEAQVVLLDYRA